MSESLKLYEGPRTPARAFLLWREWRMRQVAGELRRPVFAPETPEQNVSNRGGRDKSSLN